MEGCGSRREGGGKREKVRMEKGWKDRKIEGMSVK